MSSRRNSMIQTTTLPEERTEKISFPGPVDAQTVIQERPQIIVVSDAKCLDKKTAMAIAISTPEWPHVQGWNFGGDLFEIVIDRAIREAVDIARTDIEGVNNQEIFCQLLEACATLISRR